MDEVKKNSMVELMAYFSAGLPEDRKVKPTEFRAFWGSLTDAEKAYFNSADLS